MLDDVMMSTQLFSEFNTCSRELASFPCTVRVTQHDGSLDSGIAALVAIPKIKAFSRLSPEITGVDLLL
jgi:hypothetical protein